MLQALWSASSGMLAQQMSMDIVANNITNLNTPGYKKSRLEFQDLLYARLRGPGQVTRDGQVIENEIQVGSGTKPVATQVLFEQGSLQPTGNPTDFAITGNAFFEIIRPDGSKAYTRDGTFKLDVDGVLVTGDGYVVNLEAKEGGLLTFAPGTKINVGPDGTISQDKQLLQLEAYTFASPGDLQKTGDGVYKPTEKSGEAVLLSEIEETEAGEETEETAEETAAEETATEETTAEGTTEETGEEGSASTAAAKPKPQVFYQVMLPDGETGYVNENSFKIEEDGRLITVNQGYPLEPEVFVDTEAADSPLKPGDIISANGEGAIEIPMMVGKLNMMQFPNPAGLEKVGANLYVPTANSGNALAGGDYKVVAGALEMSNVQVVEEMVNMITAQKVYELCSRSIKTSDEMLAEANGLLRR